MEWYNRLYIGKRAMSNKRTIISRIKKNKLIPGVYVLTLPANDENVLDIYPSVTLMQPHYQKSNIFVVGIAQGRDEALDMVKQIIMESYELAGSFKVKELVKKYS